MERKTIEKGSRVVIVLNTENSNKHSERFTNRNQELNEMLTGYPTDSSYRIPKGK